jgi:alpha-galactosidase
MKTGISIFFLLLAAIIFSAHGQKAVKKGIYYARTSDWQILTPPAPEAPRINGPKVYGVRPGKEFIYRIPCEGLRPIRFTAEGLPAGLALNMEKGIITSKTPAAKRAG